jgi:hypothetical protein
MPASAPPPASKRSRKRAARGVGRERTSPNPSFACTQPWNECALSYVSSGRLRGFKALLGRAAHVALFAPSSRLVSFPSFHRTIDRLSCRRSTSI